MKKPTNSIIAAFVIVIGVVAVVTAYFGASVYLSAKMAQSDTTCTSPGHVYTVAIQNNKVTPSHTDAKHCDQLAVVNHDDILRLISFGQHNHHSQYDGVTEKRLSKDESFTVTLRTTGSFLFHDHMHDEVSGTFSVRS